MGMRTSDLALELSRDLDRRSREDRRSRLSRSCSRSAVSDRGPPFISSFTPLQQQHAQRWTTPESVMKFPLQPTWPLAEEALLVQCIEQQSAAVQELFQPQRSSVPKCETVFISTCRQSSGKAPPAQAAQCAGW